MDWSKEVERLMLDFSQITVVDLPGGTRWVEIHDLDLPPGWVPTRSRIAVEVPGNFPDTRPNGFFVEPGLTAPPGFPTPPPNGEQRQGGNWAHVCYQHQVWVPERENLWRYIKGMQRWFVEVQ